MGNENILKTKKVKKIISVILTLTLILGLMSACGKKEPEPVKDTSFAGIEWPEGSLCAVGVVSDGIVDFEAGFRSYKEKYSLNLEDIDTLSTDRGYETFLIIPRYPESEVIIESLDTSGAEQVPEKTIKEGTGLTLLTCNVSEIRSNARVTILYGEEEAVFEPSIDLSRDYATEPGLTGLPSNVYDISLPPGKSANRFSGDWEMAAKDGNKTFVYNLLLNKDGTVEYCTGQYLGDMDKSFAGKWTYNGEKGEYAEIELDLKSNTDSQALKGTYLMEVMDGGTLDLSFVSGKPFMSEMKQKEAYNFSLTDEEKPSYVLSSTKEAGNYLYEYISNNLNDLPSTFKLISSDGANISGADCWVFGAGKDSPEKFTTIYHYAVSPLGKIYFLNVVSNKWETVLPK